MQVGDLVKLKMLPRKRKPNEVSIHTAVIIEKYLDGVGRWKFRVAWTNDPAIGDFLEEDAERLFEVISESR